MPPWGEDRIRLGNANALVNLALIRSVNLRLPAPFHPEDWMPAKTGRLAAHPEQALALVLPK